jgi:hypothetical protein
MPIFVAFAAFMLLLFGQRIGLSVGPWVIARGPFGQTKKTPGQKSGVRTLMLEMVLDHDSGRMEGKCLKGRFAGRALSALNCIELLRELRTTDAQGVLLLEAYLDRQFQGWRESGDASQFQREKSHEVRAAHRKLMMKFHPDQGGSTYLAARVNEAKEILLAK